MKQYRYGMRAREFAPSCQPMRGLTDHEYTDKATTGYWSILTYNRELTADEVNAYELDEIAVIDSEKA